MEAIELLTQGTMKAAAEHVQSFPKLNYERQVNPDRYYNLVAGALRQTLKANWRQIQQEWQETLEAHMGERILRTMLTLQCTQNAVQALKMLEEEL